MDRIPRILIVDDDVEIRRPTRTLLQKYGFLVTVAGSGREMAAALDECHIDLVALDVLMPDQDGFALCRERRTRSEGDQCCAEVARRPADALANGAHQPVRPAQRPAHLSESSRGMRTWPHAKPREKRRLT